MPANTSPIGLSNVNVTLSYAANTARAFDDAIFRNLSGEQALALSGSPIGFADVDGKIAFGGLAVTNSSISQSDFGFVSPYAIIQATTNLLNPVINWSYSVASGSNNVILNIGSNNSATILLGSNTVGTLTSNVGVTASISYGGHSIGTATQYINLSGTVSNSAFIISGANNVVATGLSAQTAVTLLTASSNVASNASISFSVSPAIGTTISGNTITLTATAPTVGISNTQTYNLTTNLIYNGAVIATNTMVVVCAATFSAAVITFNTPSGSTNNQFSNSAAVNSALQFTATHSVPGANIVWSVASVSGNTPTLTTSGDLTSANVTLLLGSSTFGMQKCVANIVATLQYSNGYVLNTATRQFTLRNGQYGLTVTPPSDIAVSGYTAQSASSSISANWKAGSFAWAYSTLSGAAPLVIPNSSGNNATLSVTLYANTISNLTCVEQVSPVISFDGITISNSVYSTSLGSNFQNPNFSVSGPTSNVQVALGTVNSSITLTASDTVTGGYLTFSTDNSNVALSSTSTTVNAHIQTTTLNAQSANVNIRLYDSSNNFIANSIIPISLKAYNPNTTFNGANTVSLLGYAVNQQAVASITSIINPGADSFTLTPVKVSGSDLTIINYTGNTSQDSIVLEIGAASNAYGTINGVYNIVSNASYSGVNYNTTDQVSVSATLLNPNIVFSFANGSVSGSTPPVISNGSLSFTHTVPGGAVIWTYNTLSGTLSSAPTTTSSSFLFSVSANTSSSYSSASLSVTATLNDSNGSFVASRTATVSSTAQYIPATLTLTGPTNVTTTNVFSSTAATTLTASITGITGVTYSFSTTLLSGTAAAISTTSTTCSLSLTSTPFGTLGCSYNVTATAMKGGVSVGSTTQRVTLSAVCPMPALSISSSNAASSNNNYPVLATASVRAYSTPAGLVVWNYSLVSGTAMVVTTGSIGGVPIISFAANTSAVGTVSAVYNVTATYQTPGGANITSSSILTSVSATRNNPGFALNFVGVGSNAQYEWATGGTATSNFAASLSPALSGATFTYTIASSTGNTSVLTSNSVTGIGSLLLTNSGNTSVVSSSPVVSCSVQYNGQTIAGPLTLAPTLSVTPLSFTVYVQAGSLQYPPPHYAANVYVIATSNDPAFATQNVAWVVTQTVFSGVGINGNYEGTGASSNSVLHFSMIPPTFGANAVVSYTAQASFLSSTGGTKTASTTVNMTTRAS